LITYRYKLGTFLGVGLYIHWTFGLFLAYVGYSARGEGWIGMAVAVGLVISVFFCVTLHEYGHAMAARRFGIPTIDITLLPIGGVARLLRMPRVPWQELIVAIAGPAVNVAIVMVLGIGLVWCFGLKYMGDQLFPSDARSVQALEKSIELSSLAGWVIFLLIVNLILILFNMIPAFPMDGGRVFRSLLAMSINYRKATQIACGIGLACAFAMAWIGLRYEYYTLLLVAGFVAYAGTNETRQVEMSERLQSITVSGAMVQQPRTIHQNTTLAKLAQLWQEWPHTSLPVVSITGGVVGMLSINDLARAIKTHSPELTTAGMIADHAVPMIMVNDELEWVLAAAEGRRQLPVIDQEHHLVGILDLDTLLARGALDRFRPSAPSSVRDTFDAIS
jgi:Zn-dependent protease